VPVRQQRRVQRDVPTKVDQLTTKMLLTSPQPQPIPDASWTVRVGASGAGRFIPLSDTMELEFSMFVATLWGSPATFVPFTLYYGDNAVIAAGQMTPKAQLDALGTGITRVALGSLRSSTGDVTARVTLRGLTPGHLYRYEITPAIVGAFERWQNGSTDTFEAVACNSGLTPVPDFGFVVVARTYEGNALVYKLGHTFDGLNDPLLGKVALPANASNAGRIAITPDGTKAVITNEFACFVSPNTGQVTVINTGIQPASKGGQPSVAPTVQGSYTTATDDTPYAVGIEPTGTYAFIFIGSGTHGGKLAKLNIAAGTFTYSALLSANTSPGVCGLAVDGNGTYAYIALAADGKLIKVRLSDMTIVATVTGLTGIADVAVSPVDNATVIAVGGTTPNGRIWHLTSSATVDATLALAATVSPGAGTFNSVLTPARVAFHYDGYACMIANANTATTMSQVFHYIVPNQRTYTQWPASSDGGAAANGVSDIAVSPYGDIIVPSPADKSLPDWPGARFVIGDTNASYGNDDTKVSMYGAV
jgi:hypothetical protein